MTTAIDTNVLVALWDAGGSLHGLAREALDEALGRGSLVISGTAYAELLGAPRRSEPFLDKFCGETGIGVEWEFSEHLWKAAGRAIRAMRRDERNSQSKLHDESWRIF
jgi:predicted nucleic acid-binding protein